MIAMIQHLVRGGAIATIVFATPAQAVVNAQGGLDLTAVLVSFIATLPATIAAILAYLSSRRTEVKQAVTEVKLEKIEVAALVQGEAAVKQSENIQKIETATNSMKDALIKATHDKALLEGRVAGGEEEKARASAEGIAMLLRDSQAAGRPLAQGPIPDPVPVQIVGAVEPVPVEIIKPKP